MSIAAFFDIDGTLLPPPSLERQFRRYLRWRGELSAGGQLRWLGRLLSAVWWNPIAATHGNKFHYAGVRLATMQNWLDFLGRHPLPFHSEALDRMAWHAALGHRIVLVSGTIQPLARFVAGSLRARLGAAVQTEVLATGLEVRSGRFTGHLAGTSMCGAEKARVIQVSAIAWRLNLDASFAYGDSFLDRWMLSCVGHPVAVNPSLLLASVARRRGWPILRWSGTARADVKRAASRQPGIAPITTYPQAASGLRGERR
jgi:HAD superfamily hydrolase (TIGR01490 family)